MGDIPLVSICIPTHNGEKYLQEALASVKAQTYKNIELIISDDKSKDRTLEICERFKNDVNFPVYLYSHEPAGIGANWNYCIKNANGELIKFLFQDDILTSGCIATQVKYITDKKLEAVCSKREIIDGNSHIVNSGKWYEDCHDLQKIYLNLSFKDFYLLTRKDLKRLQPPHLTDNIFGEPISFLYRKSIFKEVGEFNNRYKQILDLEHSYRILEKYPIGIIENPLVKFRLHEKQQSHINNNSGFTLSEYQELESYLIKRFFNNLSFPMIKFYFLKNHPILIPLYQFYLKLRWLKI